MPRRTVGTRLWLEPDEFDSAGKRQRRSTWVILDGKIKKRTGCPAQDRAGAEKALAEYLTEKHGAPSREHGRHPSQILVLDALNIYLADVVPDHDRPDESRQRILKLGEFWQADTLAHVNGRRCREYVTWRTKQFWKSSKPEKTGKPARPVTEAGPRRELEDLRAAINYHRKEGLCSEIVCVSLPRKPAARDTNMVLSRSDAARLLWAAWRAKQTMGNNVTTRAVGKHIARFILLGLYTGTRSAAICGAALRPTIGRGWIDLERGIFHRRARGLRETKKRQPPCRLPDRLLAHLRRWQRLGIARDAVVEWNGKPVKKVRRGFAAAVKTAGLDAGLIPHALRHSAATWLMRKGVPLSEAADYLGMTEQVLREVYYHHHPDFQRFAADRLASSPGMNRERITVNKR